MKEHCEQEFEGRSSRVWRDQKGDLWLECGTPGCDGSPIDWADYPWWNNKHPLTKAWRKLERKGNDMEFQRGGTTVFDSGPKPPRRRA